MKRRVATRPGPPRPSRRSPPPGSRSRGLAIGAGLGAAAWLAILPASAGTAALAQPSCRPAAEDAAVAVAAVTDDLELKLRDGRLVRIAGIDPPEPTRADPAWPSRARQRLEGWLTAQPGQPSAAPWVVLHPLAALPDRWNRIPALVFVAAPPAAPASDAADASGPEPRLLAAAVLAEGLARARPDRLVHPCFPILLDAEAEARGNRRGLWADPHYAVLGADDAAGIAAQAGGMILVEGVLRIHESRGARYLTLGRDRWGFTAVVSRRDAERLARAGLDLADYAGAPVRLRGDLDLRFGARIAVTDPDQVESLEPGSVGPPAPPAASRAHPGEDAPGETAEGSR